MIPEPEAGKARDCVMVTGASGGIRRTVVALTEAGHQVTEIGRDAGRLRRCAPSGTTTADLAQPLGLLLRLFRGPPPVLVNSDGPARQQRGKRGRRSDRKRARSWSGR